MDIAFELVTGGHGEDAGVAFPSFAEEKMISHTQGISRRTRSAELWIAVRQSCGTWMDSLYRCQQRLRQRLMLQKLDDRMLQDLALSRADVEAEASKPFWRS